MIYLIKGFCLLTVYIILMSFEYEFTDAICTTAQWSDTTVMPRRTIAGNQKILLHFIISLIMINQLKSLV